MKTITAAGLFIALILSNAATAGQVELTRSSAKQDYVYGKELDVAKVISITDVSRERGVVPVTMKYEDSNGQVHEVQYMVEGGSEQT
jgi:hypothetical protein